MIYWLCQGGRTEELRQSPVHVQAVPGLSTKQAVSIQPNYHKDALNTSSTDGRLSPSPGRDRQTDRICILYTLYEFDDIVSDKNCMLDNFARFCRLLSLFKKKKKKKIRNTTKVSTQFGYSSVST